MHHASPTGTRINFIFAFTQVPPDLSDNIFVHVLRLHVYTCELARVLGGNPKGFQAAGYGIRVSEGAVWAGGIHVADMETVSYDLGWFLPAKCENIRAEVE